MYPGQTIRCGRDELSPGLRRPGHTVRVLAALAPGVVSWVLLKGLPNEPSGQIGHRRR